ncbi:MAG: hypothetical protein GY753_03285 [Gammaproteobacteria bacterium]|nr:hypothetical protein [Gammaproteobacteria bacterium]
MSASTVAGEYDSTGIPTLPGNPTITSFPVCYKHTCEVVETQSLTQSEWQEVNNIFQSPSHSPEAERVLIKKAVAHMEKLIGTKVNASSDKGGNFAGMFEDGNQMDCIDESSNTTTYLALMQKHDLLKWHRVQPTKTRGFFIFGMPHTTAVIKETGSAKVWAVDSWFYDNGVEPEILPISKWSDGWSPKEN